MEPKITVIIPIYNAEEYLPECLESVLCQTLRDIEILCIDDGSKDNTAAIIKKYAETDKRILLLQQKNQGAAVARNNGIQNARGKYVAFMDADDYYPDEDVLEALFKAAEENNVLVAGGEFSILLPDGTIDPPEHFHNDPLQFGYFFEKESVIKYQDYQFDYGYHRFIYNQRFLMDNDLYFPLLSRFQDPPFMVNALSCANEFYALKKITYSYRCGFKSIQWNVKKVNDLVSGILYIHDMANEFGYIKLQELMQKRMTFEYGHIIQRVLEENSSSISYKLGFALTFIPRKIAHLLFRNKKETKIW